MSNAAPLRLTRFWLHKGHTVPGAFNPGRDGARVQLSDGSQIVVSALPAPGELDARVSVCECLIDDLAPWLGAAIEARDDEHELCAGWDASREVAEREADAANEKWEVAVRLTALDAETAEAMEWGV